MRVVAGLCGLLLMVGCTGSRAATTGGLWAEQNLEREVAMFRLTDAQRAEQARAFELGLADELLATEQARVRNELRDCPGSARQPLALSAGDRTRDTIRIRVYDDPPRSASVAQVALADWRQRRARATGDHRLCDEARAALAGGKPALRSSNLLDLLGPVTVIRDDSGSSFRSTEREPMVDLSLYGVGWSDTVTARSPLPHYLAAVYGGTVLEKPSRPLNGDPAALVDEIAPAYPEWEPDALYVTFGGA